MPEKLSGPASRRCQDAVSFSAHVPATGRQRPRAGHAGLAHPPPHAARRGSEKARCPRLPPQHRPARHRDAGRDARAPGAVDKVIAYTPSGGTPDFVASLRDYYERLGIELGEDEIIATTGGSEAVSFAFFACAGPGDEALVVEPYYTNYNSFATLAGVRLVPLRARGEDGFHLPPRRGVGTGADAAYSHGGAVQSQQPHGHGVHARRDADGGAVLQGPWPVLHIGRGLPRACLRRQPHHQRPQLAGFADTMVCADSSVEALQRLRHPPRLPRHPQPRRVLGGTPHGAGAVVGAGPGAADRGRRDRTRRRTTSTASSPSTRRGATSSMPVSRTSPAFSCASPRVPSTSSRGCRSTMRTRSQAGC